MTLNTALTIDQVAFEQFCRRWKVVEMGIFGSALRSDSRPDSDVDLLVTFAQNARWRLFDFVRMKRELEAMMRRKVDLVERQAVERSPNYIRRRDILSTVERLYAA